MLHAGIPKAPFGGVGSSGHGFDAFMHLCIVDNISSWFEYLLGFRYPPYDKKHIGKLNSSIEPSSKRGEGIEDQRVGDGRFGFWVWTRSEMGCAGGSAGAVGCEDGRKRDDCGGYQCDGENGEGTIGRIRHRFSMSLIVARFFMQSSRIEVYLYSWENGSSSTPLSYC